MRINNHGELPKDLMLGRSRFQAWRGRRKKGVRIPQPLWALAVQLGRIHGISRTATALAVDYYSLKKRAETAGSQAPPSNSSFIELPAPIMIGKQGLFELDNGAGATMRVQLSGYDAAEIEILVRSFWNVD